jgi:hypothetical protein
MTFGDLQPGDRFLECDVIEGFRKYEITDRPMVPIITKLDLKGTSGYVPKELAQKPNPCNAMDSKGRLLSFENDYEVILIG